jgi:hypothetical protein
MKKRIILSAPVFVITFVTMFIYFAGNFQTSHLYNYATFFEMSWSLDKFVIGYAIVLVTAILALVCASIIWIPYLIAKRRQPWAH